MSVNSRELICNRNSYICLHHIELKIVCICSFSSRLAKMIQDSFERKTLLNLATQNTHHDLRLWRKFL